MTKNVFIVLFALSASLNIWFFYQRSQTCSNVQKETSVDKQGISSSADEEHLNQQVLLDSIRKLVIEKNDLLYFDLQENMYGKDFFAERGIDNPVELVTAALLATNVGKEKHPLIRFSPKNKQFQINKIKILNHQWVICDFSDGKIWGELLLKYNIDQDKKVHFTPFEELLYPED